MTAQNSVRSLDGNEVVFPARPIGKLRSLESMIAHRLANNHIIPEFMPPSEVTRFSSPPLLPGLVESITDILCPNVRSTTIQALSLEHLFKEDSNQWRQSLLASETGSGKIDRISRYRHSRSPNLLALRLSPKVTYSPDVP
jgi:hypothetical protein